MKSRDASPVLLEFIQRPSRGCLLSPGTPPISATLMLSQEARQQGDDGALNQLLNSHEVGSKLVLVFVTGASPPPLFPARHGLGCGIPNGNNSRHDNSNPREQWNYRARNSGQNSKDSQDHQDGCQ